MKNLGPVACDKVQYSSDQGNQHVIIFYDGSTWPYDDSVNTLGLTTITFDPDTGEIYDADMAINSGTTTPLALGDPVPADGYDFQSIITHETGHFLGMAHSGDTEATMFATYMVGTKWMRNLSGDDTDGICSVYLPNGDRVGGQVGRPVRRARWRRRAIRPRATGSRAFARSRPAVRFACPATPVGPGGSALVAAAFALAASGRRRARPPRM